MRDRFGRFVKGNVEPKRHKFSKGNRVGIKHGLHQHPIYRVWRRIINRCYNPNYEHYHYYGGRGIRVADEWRTDFIVFYEWAKNKWEKGLQIDRIDNDGDYTPDNCRFVTPSENMRNQPRTKYVVVKGERLSTHEAAQKYGIVSSHIIWNRLRLGWTDEEAVLTPKRAVSHRGKYKI